MPSISTTNMAGGVLFGPKAPEDGKHWPKMSRMAARAGWEMELLTCRVVHALSPKTSQVIVFESPIRASLQTSESSLLGSSWDGGQEFRHGFHMVMEGVFAEIGPLMGCSDFLKPLHWDLAAGLDR
jgi:hypothetical protein